MANRRLGILIIFMAALALALVLDRQSSSSAVTPTQPEYLEKWHDEGEAVSESLVLSIKPRANSSDLRNAFAVRNWTPPAVTARPAPAPRVEATPALPFTYLGRQHRAGVWFVFLARQNETFIGAPGDVLAGTYRIEHIGPQQLTMRYLPSGEIQTLSIGSGE